MNTQYISSNAAVYLSKQDITCSEINGSNGGSECGSVRVSIEGGIV
jgi:hypothetical protein